MNQLTEPTTTSFTGVTGDEIVVWRWENPGAAFVAVIAHGYGEHARRYDHVAERLVDEGAEVVAPDHFGHGRSGGERVAVETFDDFARDLAVVIDDARAARPGLPIVLIGHSMGGAIATRFVQLGGAGSLDALVLSGPYIGGNPDLQALAFLDPIPDVPIDPASLSRDPATGEAYAADTLVHHGPFLRQTLLAIGTGLDDISAGPSAGIPAIWLHGGDDSVAPYVHAEPAARHVIGVDGAHIRYDGARHEIFNEINRDEVLDDVVRFIRASVPALAR
ncbi:alpha/beta hydrolase [Microbacterium sp. 2FI]|uniref:alpha/beta hydrolase n=1 Tax=Microbacterium sp. 2FI TaxID=2502193 RepID=UPI0010F5B2F3|nr:alpha/beta hydrolase [Microbacterium sp. 2FI]